jgi:glyoxylase-like metal-dependent hydrolase (beta-lactamase superfamily II)
MGIEKLFDIPDIGTLTTVTTGVQWLRLPLPLPFKLNHINVWLLEEEHQYTLVDCGVDQADVAEIWDQLDALLFTHKPLGRIIVTHAHPDHIGMAGKLIEKHRTPPALISATEYLAARALCANLDGFNAQTLVDFLASHGLNPQKTEETKSARGGLFARLVPQPPLNYARIQEGDEIQIGEHLWTCHTGYGHSPEHISLICESLSLMISGDMLLPSISTNVSVHGSEPEANPLKGFLESVERMAKLPDSLTVLPSHGVPFRGLQLRCAQLLKHHEERLSDLFNMLKENEISARDAITVLFRREMDGHQMNFAMGEAIAHLHYLWKKKRASRRQVDGVWKFKAVI